MSLFENFPYTNFHELNLDWIIKKMKELDDKFDEAIASGIKIADPPQWDITTAYAPLTIVFHDDAAYLSTVPVPPGTMITDTDYWENIFDVHQLYEMIEELETELNEKIDEEVDELTDSIDDLDAITVKNNSTRHILFVGDSYTTWYSDKLFTEFVSRCGVPAAQCHNVAVSGAGFTIAQTLTFLEEVQGYTGDKTEITDIIVCGGINDASIDFVSDTVTARNTLTTAIDTFRTYCNTNYPNAKLHIAYVGGTLPTSSYYSSLHPAISQQWAFWAYTIYAGGHGFNVLKAWNSMHLSVDNYATDGIHPSESFGSAAIGEAVANAFNNNEMIYNRPQEIWSFGYESFITKTMQYFVNIDENMVTISVPDNYISMDAGVTFNAANWTKILSLPKNQIRHPHFMNINVSINKFNNVATARIVPAEIQIADGEISMKIFSLSGNSFETLTSNSGATITFVGLQDITVPLWTMN